MKTLQRHLPYPSGVSFVACNVWYDKGGFLLYRVSPENSFARLAAEFFLLLSTANISESYDKSQQIPNEDADSTCFDFVLQGTNPCLTVALPM
jgi:hypothetical protein